MALWLKMSFLIAMYESEYVLQNFNYTFEYLHRCLFCFGFIVPSVADP
jgi:hypothetical protein